MLHGKVSCSRLHFMEVNVVGSLSGLNVSIIRWMNATSSSAYFALRTSWSVAFGEDDTERKIGGDVING